LHLRISELLRRRPKAAEGRRRGRTTAAVCVAPRVSVTSVSPCEARELRFLRISGP